MTSAQMLNARAAAVASGIADPTPEDIAQFAQDPDADETAVEAELPGMTPVVDAATIQADLAALIAEAKANSTSAQVIGILEKIEGIVMPLLSKAAGV